MFKCDKCKYAEPVQSGSMVFHHCKYEMQEWLVCRKNNFKLYEPKDINGDS